MVIRSPYNLYVAISRTSAHLLPYSGRNKVLSMMNIINSKRLQHKTETKFCSISSSHTRARARTHTHTHIHTHSVPVFAIEISDILYNLLHICPFAISYVTAPVKVDEN